MDNLFDEVVGVVIILLTILGAGVFFMYLTHEERTVTVDQATACEILCEPLGGSQGFGRVSGDCHCKYGYVDIDDVTEEKK